MNSSIDPTSASLSLRDAIHDFGAHVVAPPTTVPQLGGSYGTVAEGVSGWGDTHAHKRRQNRSAQLFLGTITGQARRYSGQRAMALAETFRERKVRQAKRGKTVDEIIEERLAA
jgi:hypothetical protein